MSLKSLNSIVLGVGLGMGRAIAYSLAREGSNIALTARDASKLKGICEELGSLNVKCAYYEADVTRKDDLERVRRDFSKSFGGVDILVYNAGGWFSTETIESIDEDFMIGAFKNNVLGFFNSVKVFMEDLVSRRGVIIAVSASPFVISSGNVAYSAAKGGLTWMVKRLAKEFSVKGVRVVCVAPGPTSRKAEPLEPGELRLRSLEPQRPYYVGELVAFLASRRSGRITGECVNVDGGLSIL